MTYDDRHHQHFEEHGYVRLGQLMSASELSALRERIDALMLGRIATEGITCGAATCCNHEERNEVSETDGLGELQERRIHTPPQGERLCH